MNGERSWRLNAYLTVGLGVGILAALIFRPPFGLQAAPVPTGVSAVVESGVVGAETDQLGVFWWITAPEATVRLANNEPTPSTVELTMELTNAPCPIRRAVRVDGRAMSLEPGGSHRLVIERIELDAYQRRLFILRTGGEACPPTATDPRKLYFKVSALDVVAR